MISLDKCNRSCNAVDDLSINTCVLNEAKDINVKGFNMIARIYEAKILIKLITCDCKCKFDSIT